MKIASPGILSDFIFHRFAGESEDLGDCISVRTPANPDYFFGNFLLFPTAPSKDDLSKWIARFEEVFAPYPGILHHTFQWLPPHKATVEALEEMKATGFTIDETSVLSASDTHTVKPLPKGVGFRPIKTDTEWLAIVDAQTEQGFPSIPMEDYRRYKEATFANYRKMSEAGLGDWWGAFKGDLLVADLGLYFGDGVGRFQSVETHPDHQRQGICRAMVHHVSQHGFATHPGFNLILHADADEIAREIYMSVGYEEIEHLQSAFRAPQTKN